jgi:hypothetical protein
MTPLNHRSNARALATKYVEQSQLVRALTWLTQSAALATEAALPGAERRAWREVRRRLHSERSAAEHEHLRIAAAMREVKAVRLDPAALDSLYQRDIVHAGTASGAHALLSEADVLGRLGISIEAGGHSLKLSSSS